MTFLQELREKLQEAEGIEVDFPSQKDEYRRQVTVEIAVQAACQIIDEGYDGTDEEYDYLVSAVMMKFAEKVYGHHSSNMMKKDIFKKKD